MAIKTYKPTSAGRRHQTCSTFEEITCSTPEKSLVVNLQKTGGRNHFGRITSRHIGGGHKQKYRVIDFRRDKRDIPAKVATIEYDPNRSARIALLNYADGEKRYILAPLDLKVGDTIIASTTADIKPGNALPLKDIPLGTIIHNVELKIGKGAQLARSAGTFAQLMAKDGKYAQVKLPSGEVRMVLEHLRGRLLRGGADHGEGAHLIGNVGDPARIDLLGLAERAAHGDDRALVPLDPAVPGRDALLFLRLPLGLRQRVPRRHLRAVLGSEKDG